MTTKCVFIFLLALSCSNAVTPPVDTEAHVLHSAIVNDDFDIRIKKPDTFHKDSAYHLLIVADGSMGLGQYVLGNNPDWKATVPSNCIFVTIGHRGSGHQKRNRDFIPSDAGGYKSENFGRADRFYLFLKLELLPFVSERFTSFKSKSFIGHSLSGLFSLYAALKNESLFDHYFAISPSVWANKKELLKIEESTKTKQLSANIHIYIGSLEVFNKVLSSSKEFYKNIKSRGHKRLNVSFHVVNGKNHFSIRKPVIDMILARFSG